ncbi:MAG TPA: V-type ATPase subunit [Capillibacterium sp.]
MADRDYAYAVGRIRMLETKLLPTAFFERLLKATSVPEALGLLTETAYSLNKGTRDYEAVFEEELFQVYRILRELAGDAPELLVFLHRWDLQNLKLLLVAGGKVKPSRLGVIPFAELERMVAAGDYAALPPEFQAVLANLPEDGPDRAAALDQAYYRYGWRIFGKHTGLLRDYWRARMDLLNLMILLRLRKKGAAREEFARFLVDPGFISRKDWLSRFEEPQAELGSLLEYTPYRDLWREREENLMNLPSLERAVDDYLLGIVKKAKLVPLGIEPLIGYLLAKEREILNLRLVFTGKLNKLPEETVRRRLRDVYL